MDTLQRRWAKLFPHIVQFGPQDDEVRPAVLLFHGCGGVRHHLRRYATVAAQAGFRAFLVDSFGPRGWTNRFASHIVCSGLAFRGYERAGDVLAATWGVRQMANVDPTRIALAGWSHGSWAVMDLMTMALDTRGEARLADPTPEPLDAVKSLFLAYPYVNLISRSRDVVWKRAPRAFAVVPRDDHLGSVRLHMRAYAAAVAGGADLEIWSVGATHAFDEPGLHSRLMRYDADLSEVSIEKFRGFLLSAV